MNVEKQQQTFERGSNDVLMKILHQTFHKSSFRPKQLEIIQDILEGKDVFVLLPTGTGKSLCFQLPAIWQDFGVTVVVSPLLSLIQNQLVHLKTLGIPSASFNSTMRPEERKAVLLDLLQPKPQTRILYVTAEMLATGEFFQIARKMRSNCTFSRLVVDEAHCISQWGSDFRPDYGKIGRYKEEFPSLQICAFTATATKGVKRDILTQLKLQEAAFHTGSFNRSNIFYRVEYKNGNSSDFGCIFRVVLEQISKGNQCGIIYCHSRNDCEDLAQFLNARLKDSAFPDVFAAAYHAGMKNSDREEVQSRWLSHDQSGLRIIVATISFGMGVDNPNVRFVIHHTLPKSMEGFYQESGRAGRDGEAAESILFFSSEDEGKLKFLMQKEVAEAMSTAMNAKEREILAGKTDSFEAMLLYARKFGCKRAAICGFFGEKLVPARDCNKGCDWCKDEEGTKGKISSYFSFTLPFFGKRKFCSDELAIATAGKVGEAEQNEGIALAKTEGDGIIRQKNKNLECGFLKAGVKDSYYDKPDSRFVSASSQFLFGRPSLNNVVSHSIEKPSNSLQSSFKSQTSSYRIFNPEGNCAGLTADYREKCLGKLLLNRPLNEAVERERIIFEASNSAIVYKSKMAKAIKEK